MRVLVARPSVCHRFKRALAQAGVRVHILACLLLLLCVQVMCWVFGPAQKLPPTVAEAGAKSFACLRAVGCAHGRVWVFQTVLGGMRL